MTPPDPADRAENSAAHQLGAVAMADPIAMHNPLLAMGSNEQVICEIKRHPIGLFADYVAVGFLLLIGLVALMAAPSVLTNSSTTQVLVVGAVMLMIAATIAAGYLFIATKIYWGNRWIVTNDSITQITQTGLFTKQSSQLSFEHLEDVTAEQNGMIAEMFHYGALSAETAGATDKFTFLYCPNPNYYAKQILTARENFEQRGKA